MARRMMKTPVIALVALGLLVSTAWAQRSYSRGDTQSGTRLQEQTPQRQVSGMVLRSKDVQIRKQGQDTGQQNRIVLLETQQGERLVVDLGPKKNLQGLNIQQGMQLDAQGQVVRIGDRPVLLAKQVVAFGRTWPIQRPEQRQPQQLAAQIQPPGQWQPQQVTGQITRLKDVELRNTDRAHTVALLSTEQGRQFIVDLGPAPQVQELRLQQGSQIQVQGRPTRIGDRLVLLANQLTVNDRTVQINRPQQPQMAQRQDATRQQMVQQQTGAKRLHAQESPMINITAASSIIGRNVVDRQGRELGEVDYLMMDMQGGNVRYALVGEGGFLGMGEDLIPVPWSALEFSPQTLRLNKRLAEIRNAPRYSADRLFELTEPEVERMIVDYYLTTTPGQAQQGAQRQQQARREQRRQGQQGTQQQQTSTVKPFVLVDRDLVTLLNPPSLATAQQIRGVEVVGSMGEEIGEIDEIMIDPDHGQIAYVLLEQGGFLGFGEEWIPVPFEALQMSGDNFRLTRTEAQLRRMPQLPREDFPTQVSAEHLRQLYAEYNVTPYWERAWQTTGQAGQQGVSIAATVQDKDPQQGTLTLQTTTGSTVDLQVSQQLLSTLQTGDRIEVTIRQSPKGQQSGMHRTTPSPASQQQ